MGILTKNKPDLSVKFETGDYMRCHVTAKYGKNVKTAPRQSIILGESVLLLLDIYFANTDASQSVPFGEMISTYIGGNNFGEDGLQLNFTGIMQDTESIIVRTMSDEERAELASYVEAGGEYPSFLDLGIDFKPQVISSLNLINNGSPTWEAEINLGTPLTKLFLARLVILYWQFVERQLSQADIDSLRTRISMKAG